MMFPRLIRNAKTPVRVIITSEDINEYGERETLLDAHFCCNYQDFAATKYAKDKGAVEIAGAAYIDGDILPDAAVISSGFIEIFGVRRKIAGAQKARNLDGSVNYTRLDVI
nr:MAG TPA: hypothetical protein [Caudoviricetes sp.]